MPRRDHLFLDVLRLLVGEDQRVVGDRVQFDVEHALGLRQRIAHRAMHLRDAAQRVAVLRLVLLAAAERAEAPVELLAAVALPERHPVPADVEGQRARRRIVPAAGQPRPEARHQVVRDVGQGGAIQQAQQVRGGTDLAVMRAQRVHLGGERAEPAGERIERHRRGEVGGVQQVVQRLHRQHAGGQHLRGAVVQRQAFLVRQRDRRQSLARERVAAGHALAIDEGFAAAQQDDRQVRQRREVAGGTDRAQLRHHRHDARVEHVRQRLHGLHADAGMPAQQGVDADAEHRPHHLRREWLADADRVGDDQVVLQLDVRRAPGARRAR